MGVGAMSQMAALFLLASLWNHKLALMPGLEQWPARGAGTQLKLDPAGSARSVEGAEPSARMRGAPAGPGSPAP